MIKSSAIVFAAIVLFSITSCQTDLELDQYPTLTITSPTPGASFERGQKVEIAFDAFDDIALSDIHFRLVNLNTGDEVWDVRDFISDNSYQFKDSYTINEAHQTTLQIFIKVRDAEQKYITEEINLYVK